ncbi:GNAT family N-acetyltransferase [Luteococcus peritonei]|uniref:GNAT family N-acetyltransferase n=1 Tax=Luteococcus peritonei TaxID=88874 RepID=A0ABW4RWY4_9ACTN
MDLTTISSPEQGRRVWREVLRPAFPDSELLAEESFVAELAREELHVLAALDGDRIMGCAVGEHDPSSGVVLLTWLATTAAARGTGVGSLLLDQALVQWQLRWQPRMILGEVENPSRHRASEQHGDPRARVRFYRRCGARALALPYFQPSVSPDQPRVADMMLTVLRDDGEMPGPWVASGPVRRFWHQLTIDEPRDAAWQAMEAALAGERVEALDLHSPDELLPTSLR